MEKKKFKKIMLEVLAAFFIPINLKKWFEFISWIFLTGALAFLQKNSDVWLVDFFYYASLAWLMLFLNSTIMSFVEGVAAPFFKNSKDIKPIVLVISMLFISIIQIQVSKAINDLSVYCP